MTEEVQPFPNGAQMRVLFKSTNSTHVEASIQEKMKTILEGAAAEIRMAAHSGKHPTVEIVKYAFGRDSYYNDIYRTVVDRLKDYLTEQEFHASTVEVAGESLALHVTLDQEPDFSFRQPSLFAQQPNNGIGSECSIVTDSRESGLGPNDNPHLHKIHPCI
jgi:hypothetical protein